MGPQSKFPTYVGGGDLWEEPIREPDPWWIRWFLWWL